MIAHMEDATEYAEAVAATLRAERGAAGYNQKELAQRAGIPVATYFRYERGDRNINVAQVLQVCTALGISFAQFAQQVEQRLARLTASESQVIHGPWGEIPDWADDIAARDVDD